ncbi:MAG: hypothetical protein AABY22_16515 [Nanoarchaeota archaeon]
MKKQNKRIKFPEFDNIKGGLEKGVIYITSSGQPGSKSQFTKKPKIQNISQLDWDLKWEKTKADIMEEYGYDEDDMDDGSIEDEVNRDTDSWMEARYKVV